jgi:Flp pilus assembly protein CpaB
MRSLRLVLLSLICSPAGLASVLLLAQSVHAQTLTTLHSFIGAPHDGANPTAGVILDC